jgi:multidrug efflux pump subunit AcrA (membrane-fusion protein)
VVALCIFFSGTVRTLTTPKVRFAQAKYGKLEQESELKGKIVFPEEEEIRVDIPSDLTLTVTRIHVAPGDRVKTGQTLLSTRVTNGEKTLETLKKDYSTAQRELRTLEKKAEPIRLNRNERRWQAAWEKEEAAQSAERDAWIDLQVFLTRDGLTLQDRKLPEGAAEDTAAAFDAWKQKADERERATAAREALDRYAIPEESWTVLQQIAEQRGKMQDAEERILALQVLTRTAEKITAPHGGYITQVSVEKGAEADGDTILLKMTPKDRGPVIRVDLSGVKQTVGSGASLTVGEGGWDSATVKVAETGLDQTGHPYADAEVNDDVIYALGNISAILKDEIKVRLVTRSQESTCLIPASAVRGSGDSRYVYLGETESSSFGGTQMKARKKDVTVLAESGSTVSVAEDLSYVKVLYMEDRALTEGGAVMEYVKDNAK